MAHEVFISYSSNDRPWAEKLAGDLKGRGVTVFYDQSSLQDGEAWRAQLDDEIRACKQLVCLWSKNAKDSMWVQAEMNTFRVTHETPDNKGPQPLLVPLDSQPHIYTEVQNIQLPALQTAYAGTGVKSVTAPDWIAFIDRVFKAVRSRKPGLQVPVALLTLDAKSASFSAADLAKIQKQLGLSAADLQGRYGARRLDWRPFTGDQNTIESYLDETRTIINKWLADNQIDDALEWEHSDDEFWAEDDKAARVFAGRIEGKPPGLIVIDPVAASQVDVQLRLKLFDRCLKLADVAIVALHPSAATQQDRLFREWVAKYTVTLLDPFVAPRPLPDISVSARLGIDVDDIGEMHRLLKTSIGDSLRRRSLTAKPAAAAITN